MSNKKNEYQFQGLALMFGSAFVSNKRMQADLFLKGLNLTLGGEPDHISKITNNIIKKQTNKSKDDIIDIDYTEVKE